MVGLVRVNVLGIVIADIALIGGILWVIMIVLRGIPMPNRSLTEEEKK